MGFSVTTLIFAVVGIVASLCTRICFNRGPSANLYAMLASSFLSGTYEISPNFGSYCNNMLLDDVGDCISSTDETAHSTYIE
ncbi:hypothetical protein JHK84_038956 [Glycine max]|nr:hypothetical protein JHK85_039307 [Glycine max]KAG5120616.1 hypothetical protein JHK84_038956 [Glycine max]